QRCGHRPQRPGGILQPLPQVLEPADHLLQQGGVVVVDGLGKLRAGPLLSFVRRRRQRCLGGQGKNHRHPWAAALASSTSRASVRIRTSTYNRATTAAMNGVVTAEEITVATRLMT